MTGLMIAGVVALVALYAVLVLMGYRGRFAHGDAHDDTFKRRGRWYNVRTPIKQSVVTDTHGDLVHQDGSTTATAAEKRGATSSAGPNDYVI